MRKEVPLPVALAVIILVGAVAAFVLWRAWAGRRQLSEEAIRPPTEVTQEMQKRQQQPPPTGYIPPPSPYGR